ncbi:MAG: hypothetical protein ACREC9_12395 [Methylocella sp.]
MSDQHVIAEAEAAWRKAHAATGRAAAVLRAAERTEFRLFADFAFLVQPRFGHFMHRLIERQEKAEHEKVLEVREKEGGHADI